MKSTGDFKIQVAVRLKEGRQTKRQFVLPLHQRLRLLKKGELLYAAAEREGIEMYADTARMLSGEGEELPAELVEALVCKGAFGADASVA